ncbi:hypothetical protein G6F57_013149 [Rhizopus arrhizus]|nr:hypothetical protein G6F57_013149 [Rhizopus arrhizus]
MGTVRVCHVPAAIDCSQRLEGETTIIGWSAESARASLPAGSRRSLHACASGDHRWRPAAGRVPAVRPALERGQLAAACRADRVHRHLAAGLGGQHVDRGQRGRLQRARGTADPAAGVRRAGTAGGPAVLAPGTLKTRHEHPTAPARAAPSRWPPCPRDLRRTVLRPGLRVCGHPAQPPPAAPP